MRPPKSWIGTPESFASSQFANRLATRCGHVSSARTARRPLAPTPRLQTASHMMIANPFGGGVRSLFSTHPPMEQRIARLEQLAKSDPRYLH